MLLATHAVLAARVVYAVREGGVQGREGEGRKGEGRKGEGRKGEGRDVETVERNERGGIVGVTGEHNEHAAQQGEHDAHAAQQQQKQAQQLAAHLASLTMHTPTDAHAWLGVVLTAVITAVCVAQHTQHAPVAQHALSSSGPSFSSPSFSSPSLSIENVWGDPHALAQHAAQLAVTILQVCRWCRVRQCILPFIVFCVPVVCPCFFVFFVSMCAFFWCMFLLFIMVHIKTSIPDHPCL